MNARRDLSRIYARRWTRSWRGSWRRSCIQRRTALLTKPSACFRTAICAKGHLFTPSDYCIGSPESWQDVTSLYQALQLGA